MNEETLKNLDILKRKLAQDVKPILFTGAGFSYNAKNANGDSIPLGSDLKIRIISDVLCLDINSRDGQELASYPLDRVYDYAQQENRSQLISYIIDLFSNVKASDYHKILIRFPWQKIYTINIDDLVENELANGELNVIQSSVPLSRKNKNAIDYIKLHGCIRNPDGGFIFSHREYLGKISGPLDIRLAKLVEDLQTQDFVCIGAAGDELDISHYLLNCDLTERGYGNLFIVNPSPSLIFRQTIKRSGAKLIEMNCEDFARWFGDNAPLVPKRKGCNQQFKRNFLNISDVQKCYATYDNSNTRLYLGDEPTWKDILTKYDFATLHEEEIVSEVQRLLADTNENIVFTLLSKAIGGKSVQLKRLGLLLFGLGYDVYEYIGCEFKINNFISGTSDAKNDIIILLIDDASGYYNKVAQLLDDFPSSKRLVVLCASRPYFHFKKYYDIRYFPTYRCFNLDEMDGKHQKFIANSAINTLKNKGLLGKLKGKSEEERLRFFLKKGDLSEALWEIFEGSNLRKRYESAYSYIAKHIKNECDSDSAISLFTQKILIGLAIFRERELPYFPNTILVHWFGSDLNKVEEKINDIVKTVDIKGISLRTNMLTNIILASAPERLKMEVVRDILKIISPYIGRDRDSYWNQIQSRLMNTVFLRKKLKIKSVKIKELFNKLLRYYENDENYYIQLGRVEQEMGKYELALNHFAQADIHAPNLYTVRNAIARNYLKQSYDDGNLGKAEASVCYDKGKSLMFGLIEERETYQVRAYSVHSLVVESVKYWQIRRVSPAKDDINNIFVCLKDAMQDFPDDPRIIDANNRFMSFMKKNNLQSLLPKFDMSGLKMINHLFTRADKELLLEDDVLD